MRHRARLVLRLAVYLPSKALGTIATRLQIQLQDLGLERLSDLLNQTYLHSDSHHGLLLGVGPPRYARGWDGRPTAICALGTHSHRQTVLHSALKPHARLLTVDVPKEAWLPG